MFQIVSNLLVLAAITYLTFLYRKVISPFSQKYSEEKGRRLATREDFEQILAEQRRTTAELESIKAEITNDLWRKQRNWEATRDAYVSLIGATSAVISAFAAIPYDARTATELQATIPGVARAVTAGKIFLKHPAAQEAIRVYENSFLSTDQSNARFITDAKMLNAALVVAAREELAGQPT
jgi:hypothetical protein